MICFSRFFRCITCSDGLPGGLEVSDIQNVNLYTYKELQIATDNFSSANKIGQGGFGSVYKGEVRNGNTVAIKVLSSDSRQGVKEFLTEIKVISRVEHENLVKLYGCCVEKEHRILVYGYLDNNSLAQTLLGKGHGIVRFSWNVRRNISIGIARGLSYLHEEVEPHIIHRDIKASNILLDRDLRPIISDFGLAKLMPPNLTHVSTQVAGTAGYLAPEYAIRGQVTRKIDVYGFGVLLLEIVSGRTNTNRRLPRGQQYLLERAWDLFEKGELENLVDTSLDGDFDVEEAIRFLQIGLLCLQDNPMHRPSMSTVLSMLLGDIDVNAKAMIKPRMRFNFLNAVDGKSTQGKAEELITSATVSTDTGKLISWSSPSENTSTSHATMTFSAIYDRSI